MVREIYPGGEDMVPKTELDKSPIEITWLGRLDGGHKNPQLWSGAISADTEILKDRFQTDEKGVADRIEELKRVLEAYFIPANPNAQVRCIDGRTESHSPAALEPELGPQVAGGTPAAALSYRFARFSELSEETTVQDDFSEVAKLVKKLDLPYEPGAHDDEHNGVGCGALKKMLEIMAKMQDREPMYGFAKDLAGDYFDDEIFDELENDLATILGSEHKDHYFMKDPVSGEYEYAPTLLEKTEELGREEDRKSVEVLLGDHNEVLLVINTVAGTTFNRDKLSEDTGHLAQVFNYDLWISIERAKQLFPDDERAQKKVVVSQVMFAVATAMVLTDGSLEVGIRA